MMVSSCKTRSTIGAVVRRSSPAAHSYFAHELDRFNDFTWRDCCDDVARHCCDGLWRADCVCGRDRDGQPQGFAKTSRCSFLLHLVHDSLDRRRCLYNRLGGFDDLTISSTAGGVCDLVCIPVKKQETDKETSLSLSKCERSRESQILYKLTTTTVSEPLA
jgi:hypothetical protein